MALALVTAPRADYLDSAALAVILRGDLKRAFPGVTCSVRTRRYAGGSTVDVSWTDGPTVDQVTDVIGRYQVEGFDGMTDSRTNRGPVRLDDGRLVHIGCFVFTHRTLSAGFRARLAAFVARHGWAQETGDASVDVHRLSGRAVLTGHVLRIRRARW